MHFFAVAKAKANCRLLASGQRRGRLEHPPVADDLIEPLLLPAVFAWAELANRLPPVIGCLWILSPILEDVGQVLQRLFDHSCPRLRNDLLTNLDRVEFVRQLESLDAAGELGDRLI